MVSQDPNDPNFGLETDETSPNFGLPEQPKEEGGVLSGIAAGVGRLLNPVNLVRGALDIQPRSGLQEVLRTGRMLSDIVGGKSIQEALQAEAPEVVQQQQAITGQLGAKEQAAEITGLAAQTALLAAPFVHGRLSEIAGFAKPEPVIPEVPVEPLAAEARAATTPEEVIPNAEQIQGPTRAYGDVQLPSRTEQGEIVGGEVPAPVGGEGVPPRGQGQEVQEIAPPEVTPPEEAPAPEAEPQPPAAAAPEVRPIEQLSPEEAHQTRLDEMKRLQDEFGMTPREGALSPERSEEIHAADVAKAIMADKPVSAAAVEKYGLSTEGYTKQGDLYVKSSPVPEAEAPTTAAPETPTEPAAPEAAPPAPPEVPPTIEGSIETAPEVRQQTGISNQRLTEAYGDSAPVATTGKGPGTWKDEGLSRLDNFQKTGDVKNDPYSVLTNLREGRVPMADVASDVSLLRAEHQRLLEDARNAEGTPEYEAKSQAALDMATSIKGVAHGPASDVLRALQEYDKPRYDNVTDFDQALREREGRESTSSERVQFKQIADDVSTTRNGAEQEINGAQKRLNKFPRMKFDEAFKNVHDQITELTKDCVL